MQANFEFEGEVYALQMDRFNLVVKHKNVEFIPTGRLSEVICDLLIHWGNKEIAEHMPYIRIVPSKEMGYDTA